MPIGSSSGEAVYTWTQGAWTGCSAPCGGGAQQRHVACIATRYDPQLGGTVDTLQLLDVNANASSSEATAYLATLSVAAREQLIGGFSAIPEADWAVDPERLGAALGLRN